MSAMPAREEDGLQAHLFLCLENGHYAVSREADGANLPLKECRGGWRFIRSFHLSVREPLPVQGDPEPVIRALRDAGYYLPLRAPLPHGSSQINSPSMSQHNQGATTSGNMTTRVEDNRTLIRAQELARSGSCRTWVDVQQHLQAEQHPRVANLFQDSWLRERLTTLCLLAAKSTPHPK